MNSLTSLKQLHSADSKFDPIKRVLKILFVLQDYKSSILSTLAA